MVLLIDIGNTRTIAAFVIDGQMEEAFLFPIDDLKELQAVLDDMTRCKLCYISSVREIPEPSLELLKEYMRVHVISASIGLPFEMDYATPNTLGPDRIAVVAAATSIFPSQNVLIIDMGSCITYDILDAEGTYHGGAISPGLSMRFRAMHAFTAKLPLVEPTDKTPLIGDSTENSMRSGVLHGIQAELEGIIKRYEALYENLKVIITGGDNKYFDKRFKINIFAASNLVLKGLKVIYEFNEIE